MKLQQIYEMCTKKMKEEEEVMTAAEIESTLDDIQNEVGDDPVIAKMVKKVTGFLMKKDLVSATKSMETLMDKVRDLND